MIKRELAMDGAGGCNEHELRAQSESNVLLISGDTIDVADNRTV